jgi:hypothetical protein
MTTVYPDYPEVKVEELSKWLYTRNGKQLTVITGTDGNAASVGLFDKESNQIYIVGVTDEIPQKED